MVFALSSWNGYAFKKQVTFFIIIDKTMKEGEGFIFVTCNEHYMWWLGR